MNYLIEIGVVSFAVKYSMERIYRIDVLGNSRAKIKIAKIK